MPSAALAGAVAVFASSAPAAYVLMIGTLMAAIGVTGVRDELAQVAQNLIDNAVKYTPDEGSIQIRWWGDEHGAHLSVQDSGLGIEAKHLLRWHGKSMCARPRVR